MKTTSKWYDEEKGWGDVVTETEQYVIVRFDADPWNCYKITKEVE